MKKKRRLKKHIRIILNIMLYIISIVSILYIIKDGFSKIDEVEYKKCIQLKNTYYDQINCNK